MEEKLCKHNKKPAECVDGCNPSHPGYLAKLMKKNSKNKLTDEEDYRGELVKERRKREYKRKKH
jgi:hypothetical protein